MLRCFYLDSPANAKHNGMSIRYTDEELLDKRCDPIPTNLLSYSPMSSFEELAKKIVVNGGKIVDLDEPKLTHIVLDKRDTSRRLELTKRTSK